MAPVLTPLTQETNEERNETGATSTSVFVYVLTVYAALGGFLFGYDTGIISGSMLLIRPYFKLDTIWTELIVSGTVGAAAVFASCAGFLADFIGRRKTIMTASVVFLAGALVLGAAPNKEVLLVGRIVVGAGVGFASVTVPVYIAEASPPKHRGKLVTYNQLFITIGILVSSIIAGGFSTMKETGWRYMLGLAGAPALFQFIGFIFLPESPRWLLDKGHEEQARSVLVKIRGTVEVEEEIAILKDKIKEFQNKSHSGCTISDILRTPHVRKALFVGAGLQVFQQVCGINTIIYYSASIMALAGFPTNQAIWLVVLPNSVNFLATFIGLCLVDRLGRRRLLLGSFIGIFVGMALLATGFQLSASHSPDINVTETLNTSSRCLDQYSDCYACVKDRDCGFCYNVTHGVIGGSCLPVDPHDHSQSSIGRCNATSQSNSVFRFNYDSCPTIFMWMPLLGMVIFVFSFAPGLGPMPWAVNSEIYPLWARGTCAAITGATNWTMNLIVALTFLTLTETITRYGTFWLYSGMCILGGLFTFVFLPETKGKPLEEVEQLFKPKIQPEEKIHFIHNDALNKGHTKYDEDMTSVAGTDM